MKLFFDARYITSGFHDGISRYSAELGSALAALTDVTFIVSEKAQLKKLPKAADYVLIHAPTSNKEPFTARVLNKYSPDVVFSPMQTMGTAGRKFKVILTVHDLIYYRHSLPPRSLRLAIRVGWRLYHMSYVPQRLVLNSADIVATISKTSERDIRKVKLTKRPIVILPNAPRDLSSLTGKKPSPSDIKNIVYMGSFMPYKNVEALIKSMEFLPEFKLHLLSRITNKRKAQLTKLIPSGAEVVFHNGVTDEQYANLLVDNALLVTASFDEGYGLPIAEAAALGVPSVISNLDVFKEVAGDGALYFNPNDPQDIAKKVEQASDPENYKNLSRAAKEHVKRFDWNKSAKVLLETVEKLVKDK